MATEKSEPQKPTKPDTEDDNQNSLDERWPDRIAKDIVEGMIKPPKN